MPHDKIRAAARERMAQTGEPYAAARRGAIAEHRARGQNPAPGTACTLAMSGEIHDWLADLRASNPRAAARVAQALAALMEEGPGLGEPLVASAAESWPWVLSRALDPAYQEILERMNTVRRGTADAASLCASLQQHAAELQAARVRQEDTRRHALDAGTPDEAAQAASDLAAAVQQEAEVQQLLSRVTKARDRMTEASRSLIMRAETLRTRKEVLKASYAAAEGRLKINEAFAVSGLTGDGSGQQDEGTPEAISAARAELADATARMERELGQQAWPEGLMELQPGAPVRSDIRILFAVEPPGTALLIAVLEGLDVVEEQFPEALMASADMLHRVRAGQAPEASARGYDTTQAFVAEYFPDGAGAGPR